MLCSASALILVFASQGEEPRFDGTQPAPGTTETNAASAVAPAVKGDPNLRARDAYGNVINQFAVGVNPRYRPRNGNTYCNIFVWDVTRAMGAEIPHWLSGSGRPAAEGEGWELDANASNDWLHDHGREYGWRQVDDKEAQALANKGHPAVASWRNPGGIGHIAVIRPGEIDGSGPAIAQAGAQNFNSGHVYDSFPRDGRVEFWVNDEGLDEEERAALEEQRRREEEEAAALRRREAMLERLRLLDPGPLVRRRVNSRPPQPCWWAFSMGWYAISLTQRPFALGALTSLLAPWLPRASAPSCGVTSLVDAMSEP